MSAKIWRKPLFNVHKDINSKPIYPWNPNLVLIQSFTISYRYLSTKLKSSYVAVSINIEKKQVLPGILITSCSDPKYGCRTSNHKSLGLEIWRPAELTDSRSSADTSPKIESCTSWRQLRSSNIRGMFFVCFSSLLHRQKAGSQHSR